LAAGEPRIPGLHDQGLFQKDLYVIFTEWFGRRFGTEHTRIEFGGTNMLEEGKSNAIERYPTNDDHGE
jgi:hypothetical protein